MLVFSGGALGGQCIEGTTCNDGSMTCDSNNNRCACAVGYSDTRPGECIQGKNSFLYNMSISKP